MAKSNNDKYSEAKSNYDDTVKKYTGDEGYKRSLEAAKQGEELANDQIKQGRNQGQMNFLTAQNLGSAGLSNVQDANKWAANYSTEQNRLANSEAQKYAAQQASLAASGAQSQATTAARAAGMNKAQAAMMGAQQNSVAYQNAIGNAYSQQLQNASGNQNTQLANYNNAYENQANRLGNQINAQQSALNQNINNQQGLRNQNINTQQGLSQQNINNQQTLANQNALQQQNNITQNQQYAGNMANQNNQAYTQLSNTNRAAARDAYTANDQYERNLRASYEGQNVSGLGSQVNTAAAVGQQKMQNDQANAATAAQVVATAIPVIAALASDERLKHYKECTKKVTVRSPKSIQSLKMNVKKEL
jgi:hypothetical protein